MATNYVLCSSDPAVYELHCRLVDTFNTIYHNIITSKLLNIHLLARVAGATFTRSVQCSSDLKLVLRINRKSGISNRISITIAYILYINVL